jgi:hypothetical protein
MVRRLKSDCDPSLRLTRFHETPRSRVVGVGDPYTIHTEGVQ